MGLEVTPVAGRADLRAFIDLPFRLYDTAPLWVPPLRFDIKDRLDRAKNPFFEHAEAEYFLARRDGRVVGRISAQVDQNFNAFQDNDWGLFGWFDCEDDQEAARALVDAAAEWLTARGRDRMVGPMSFTTNDEGMGTLVDGFDRLPTILNQWNFTYEGPLLESAGLVKAMDVNMWELYVTGRERVHQAIW